MDRLQTLEKFILAAFPLPPGEMQAFLSIWKNFDAPRKTILTRAGEVERYLYFVTDGVQRVYYADEFDREATIVFSYTPSFCGVADSFLLQSPSRFFAETLSPSSFLRTTFTDLDALMKKNRPVESMIRTITNLALSGVLERMVEIQCFTAEEKFKTLFRRSPHLLNLIPHKYIANYLGIDPTNFSKLLSKVRIG
jgi:CRP-like cAMP-binding protein